MMRTLTHTLRTILLITIFISTATTALAHDFKVEGIYYNIVNGNEASVTYETFQGTDYYDVYYGDVTIPESVTYGGTTYSVTSIGEYAFMDCSGLTSITIPNSVTYIGELAFYGCSELTNVTIPNSVTEIGYYAFSGCNGLTSVTIPNSVTTIDDGLFINCTRLTSINIPNSVTKIGNQSFYGCSGLASATIGNSVTNIGDGAFYHCSALTSIIIPNSVTKIGDQSFSGCSGLASITVESGNPKYDSRNNCNAIIETATNTLFLGCKNTTIPNTVTAIGNEAFDYCIGLSSVTIPNSVTSISYGAFEGCSGLTSIIVESGNPIYDSRNNCNAIIKTATNALFTGCKNTTIPNSVTSIDCAAFKGCSGLTNINIPNSVTEVGQNAFWGCSGLTSINIPNSVTYIGELAFCACSGLTSVNIPNSVITIDSGAFRSCSGLTSVIIPNSVTSIGSGAFSSCSSLTNLTIGNSVTTIGNFAFGYCDDLTNVTCLATTPPTNQNAFPSAVTSQATLYVPEKSVSAYQSAYNWKDFSQIVGITVTPAIDDFEVDGIWYRALSENTAMVISRPGEENLYSGDVVIPEEVNYDDYTFTVTAIDEGAFEDCYELNSVVIGDAVETIGENAFQGCSDLTSVTIGSGVTSIGAKAFNYCNALQTVTCMGTVPPAMASSNCFSNAAYSRAVLKVPRPEIETYAAADYWYKFNNIEGWGYLGPGDVNGDGVVGMDDLTRLINILVTDDLGGTDPTWADVNGNGMVNMNDLTALINILVFGHQ